MMARMEEIELQKLRKALDRDVTRLVDKYLKAMEWDIPEADEGRARRLIVDEIRAVLDHMKNPV
jgi:hypothetical protein